ncbi:MAG: hypothetical protein ACJ72O_08630 [Marmoricola sp.]
MEASTGKGRGSTTLAVGIVAAVLLVVGIIGSVVYGVRGAGDNLTTNALTSNNGDPLISDTETAKAVGVADQFCLRMDNVDGSDPDGYVKKVEQLLTTKQKTKFASEFAQFQKLGMDANLKGTGTILASGVSDIDPDSATVLVAHDSAVVDKDGTTQRHYRWSVSLRKVDGRWLVDDFTPVS